MCSICTGTCFIQKIYAPSSSLLQGIPTSSFVSSSRFHLNITTGPPSDKKKYSFIFQSSSRFQLKKYSQSSSALEQLSVFSIKKI